jgi:hypothetical protein
MAKLLEVWCFKGGEEVVFWFVFVFGLFCCFASYCEGILVSWLLRRDLGELVLVMEHDPNYLMETLYELCESRFYERIGEEISGE